MNTRNEQRDDENEGSVGTRVVDQVDQLDADYFSNVLNGWFPAAVKQLYALHGLPYQDDYYDFRPLLSKNFWAVNNPLGLLATLVVLDNKCHLKMNHDMLKPVLISTIETRGVHEPIQAMNQLMCQLVPQLSIQTNALMFAHLFKYYFIFRDNADYQTMCRSLLVAAGLTETCYTDLVNELSKHHLLFMLKIGFQEHFIKNFHLTLAQGGYFQPGSPFAGELPPALRVKIAELDDELPALLKREALHEIFVAVIADLELGYLYRHFALYAQLEPLMLIQYSQQPKQRGQLYWFMRNLYQTGLGEYFIDRADKRTSAMRQNIFKVINSLVKSKGRQTIAHALVKIDNFAKKFFTRYGLSAVDIEQVPNLANFSHARELLITQCKALCVTRLKDQSKENRERNLNRFLESLNGVSTRQIEQILPLMELLSPYDQPFVPKMLLTLSTQTDYLPLFKHMLLALDKADLLRLLNVEDFETMMRPLIAIAYDSRLAMMVDDEKLEQAVHAVLTTLIDRLLQSERCDVNDKKLQALCDEHFIDLDVLADSSASREYLPLADALLNIINPPVVEEAHEMSHEASAPKRVKLS